MHTASCDKQPETNNTETEMTREEEKSNDSDLSVVDNNFESFNEDEDTDQKEIEGESNISRTSNKNSYKEKYKIYTNKYDEIINAEKLENEEEINRLNEIYNIAYKSYLIPIIIKHIDIKRSISTRLELPHQS